MILLNVITINMCAYWKMKRAETDKVKENQMLCLKSRSPDVILGNYWKAMFDLTK